MNSITIKSVANNRVRLKSDIFKSKKNIDIIKREFEESFISFRENLACKSIVFTHSLNISLENILEKLNQIFYIESNIRKVVPTSVCISEGSCSVCELKKSGTKISWRRKLLEFGLLSGYAIYIFVKENILGIALSTSPLSLTAAIALFAATPLLKESLENIKNRRFSLETFMGATLVLAIFFGEVTAAFEIIYILRGGMLLEEYIATKSKDEIHKLVELDVQKVYILVDGVEVETNIDSVNSENIVVVRSGEKIPVDGIVSDGSAEIDEALINGRSEPEFKSLGDEVFAGTICQKGRIYIKVSATGSKTYISRTIREVESSLALKSPSEVEADRLASKLLKLGTALTVGTFLLSGSLINAFAVMIVMSCPCATVLAASTAISGGIANGAKNGILIKGGEALENVSQANVFCFDKTGTLTTGKPIVSSTKVADGVSEKDMIFYAALAEYRNTHPIAKAIIEHAKSNNIELPLCPLSEIVPGYGVKAKVDEDTILAGNGKFLNKHNIDTLAFKEDVENWLERGESVVYVAKNEKLLGVLGFKHEIRDGVKEMIEELRNQGVKHIALLTGDELKVANSFALDFGFDTVYANQTPTQKASAIDELKERYGKIVMVGDGVNDTYAMSKADVAISFAAGGSEAAIAVSDIAITHSHPQDVIYLHALSKKSLKVVNQNYWIGTGTNLIGVAFASVGMLSPVAAGAIHIGHTIGIMANSSKLALMKEKKVNYS